jgi:hypothetical protein
VSLQRENASLHSIPDLSQISDNRDAIIVTRSSQLISAVSRVRLGEYRIWGGSFIGGGGSTEATAEEEYLSWSPHWAHLMRLTLQMGWHDVHRALGKL